MTEKAPLRARRGGRIKDARGRLVTRCDPVKMYLLNQDVLIPGQALGAMAEEILPGVKRKRLIQVVSAVVGVLFIVGGNLVYFRWFSTWKGLDPVNTTIYIVQAIVLLSGPFIAFRMARSEYANLIVATMLRYRRCPHCGYDLRFLPVDPADGATLCPECGCAWRLDEARAADHAENRGKRTLE